MTDTTSPAARTSVRHLLTGRFGWFFAGRTVDLAGSSMTTVALALAVLRASGRPGDLGIVLTANMVPTLVLLLVGGAVADRVSRRVLLIAANTASAATMGAMGTTLITGHYSLVLISGLSLVNGTVSAFTSPALRGIVPELVERQDLQRANALLSSARNTVRIVAPTVASAVVATAGGGWALTVDALSYALAALAFTRIPEGSRATAAKQALWRDLVEGWSVFRSMRWVVLMTVSFALINAFNVGPWNVLGPMVVSGHSGALGWGTVLSVRAVGLLAMSALAVRIVLRRPLRAGRVWGTLAALPLLAIGLSGQAWVVAVAAFIGGLGFTVAGLTWETALQSAVPAASLSRVAAYDDLLSYVAIPLSQVAVGPLAQAYGAGPVSIACGVAYVAASLFPLASRELRNVGSEV
ncbi:MAG TPA: MFS transporter [Streptosporangiales bacterium]